MPLFLSPDQIVEIHRAVVGRYGGDPRVRDYGLLESAALAPQESRFGELINKSLRSQAATYWLSLALNRPFLEGNARTGLVVCEIFLEMNGFQIDLDERQLEDLVSRMASRQISTKDRLMQSLRVRAL
ncbi:MAG TPA: type II toxin-antitoxin system death-on-curing family toxin [Fimbriimonadaceae bacterium]|jgi:death-on-curing protein